MSPGNSCKEREDFDLPAESQGAAMEDGQEDCLDGRLGFALVIPLAGMSADLSRRGQKTWINLRALTGPRQLSIRHCGPYLSRGMYTTCEHPHELFQRHQIAPTFGFQSRHGTSTVEPLQLPGSSPGTAPQPWSLISVLFESLAAKKNFLRFAFDC